MSFSAKVGCSTRSLRTSSAMGTCSSSTFMLKQTHSLAVKASMLPPMESTWRAISSAVRCLVPLKTMCSIKWEMPFHCRSSSRDPVLIHTPIETERMCCISSVMMASPLGSTSRRMLRTSSTMILLSRSAENQEPECFSVLHSPTRARQPGTLTIQNQVDRRLFCAENPQLLARTTGACEILYNLSNDYLDVSCSQKTPHF